MKTRLKVAVGTSLALLMVSRLAGAGPDVTNTTSKGSVLIFPDIDVTTVKDDQGIVTSLRDTIIRLENDYIGDSALPGDVAVKCYWMNGTKFSRGWMFRLTRSQTVWFSAMFGNGTNPGDAALFPTEDGPLAAWDKADRYKGDLKCWAVNDAGTAQISWNHLSGTATVVDYAQQTAYEYNSWNFRALPGNPQPGKYPRQEGDKVGKPGVIRFNGEDYDYCPKYLMGDFTPTGVPIDAGWPGNPNIAVNRQTRLVLASCRQDFRQDYKLNYTKLQFNVWSSNEVGFSGSFHCMDSWADFTLDEIDQIGSNFGWATLKTAAARFEVRGVGSDRCIPYLPEGAHPKPTGLVGIIVRWIDIPPLAGAAQLESRTFPTAAALNTAGKSPGAGKDANPEDAILWDPYTVVP